MQQTSFASCAARHLHSPSARGDTFLGTDSDMKDHKSSEVECRDVALLTLGYIQALVETSRTDAARELLLDWKFMVEKSQQNDGDK